MPMLLYYAIAAVAGVLVGALLVGVILGLHARQQLAKERERRAIAEEKNFRIPKLESAVARKNTELKDLQEHLSDREQRLSEIQNRLSQRDRELFEKTAQLAEKTVELSGTRANLAAKQAELEEEKRYSAAKLAEQKRLSRERLERLHEAQTQVWHDFRQLFAEALLEDQPEFPKLVRNKQAATEDVEPLEKSVQEDLREEDWDDEEDLSIVPPMRNQETFDIQETIDREEGEDPLAGFDLNQPEEQVEEPQEEVNQETNELESSLTESEEISLDQPVAPTTDFPFSIEDKEPETIELTLMDDELETIQGEESKAGTQASPAPIPIRELALEETGDEKAEKQVEETEKKKFQSIPD
ncbi:MAG: hypothetical protein JXA82_01980 [Sedimentisphaerales bacterium]|nr:hypothetical protein [Sedimentisphaerales bacterium]